MSGLLVDKVALVTGGSSGIGRATAVQFARNGAKVVIADRKVEEGERVAAGIRADGGEATFVATDVSQEDQVANLMAVILKTYNRLDVAFNNAGVSGQIAKKISEIQLSEWQEVLATDLTGVFLCMRAELPVMIGKGGTIVNMSSIAGLIGTTLINPSYHASKFGVIGLTLAAALDHAKDRVRVNAVCPGFIDTAMVRTFLDATPGLEKQLDSGIPLGKIGTPDDVAALVTWLSSDEARYITGSTFTVDGGIIAQ